MACPAGPIIGSLNGMDIAPGTGGDASSQRRRNSFNFSMHVRLGKGVLEDRDIAQRDASAPLAVDDDQVLEFGHGTTRILIANLVIPGPTLENSRRQVDSLVANARGDLLDAELILPQNGRLDLYAELLCRESGDRDDRDFRQRQPLLTVVLYRLAQFPPGELGGHNIHDRLRPASFFDDRLLRVTRELDDANDGGADVVQKALDVAPLAHFPRHAADIVPGPPP